ncbi:hypothetical protein DL96DRAFT_1588745 [Flagelloscypha sp. PMI_526]|nr:hypothetical protein DL96DRAFT_1588745 [Flagelloscypha sp. PMI_526]
MGLGLGDISAALKEGRSRQIAKKFYDYLLMLRLEIRVVWKSPWSLSSSLFLLCRYVVFPASILGEIYLMAPKNIVATVNCKALLAVISFLRGLGVLFAQAIFTLRTIAINDNSPKLRRGLFCFHGLVFLGFFAVGATLFRNVKCTGLNFWWAHCSFNTVFMAIPFYQAYRRKLTNLRLYQVVYTDVLSLINILNDVRGNPHNYGLAPFQIHSLHSILACRVLLHIRKIVSNRDGTSRSPEVELGPVTTVRFASHLTTEDRGHGPEGHGKDIQDQPTTVNEVEENDRNRQPQDPE